ncbi:MAG TPA: hypothetical protein PLS69_14575, partial [Terricaulis sp.]|nr:hypothetical protein [Terricaulis sp.]
MHANFADTLKYLAAHRDRTSFLRRENWDALHRPPFGGPYAMAFTHDHGDRVAGLVFVDTSHP